MTIIALIVCIILSVSYILFGIGQNQKAQKLLKQKHRMQTFFHQQADAASLQLVGLGVEEQNSIEPIKAIRRIQLSNNAELK